MKLNILVACLVFFASSFARAADGDKALLFNTFYLDGERVTYVLIMRPDRTFDLYGPDNDRISGRIRADAEHVTLTAGEVKRYFHYDVTKNRDLKLGLRPEDKMVKGNLLGEMPPVADSLTRTMYVTEENWKKRGRTVRDVPGKPAPAAPIAPVITLPPPESSTPPVSVPAPPPPAPAADAQFTDIAGSYYLGGTSRETLAITADGRFDYIPADGARQQGTLMRADDELTFMGANHKRQFTIRNAAAGLELKRRQTDIVKAGDALGRMTPQEREPVVWLKQSGAAAVAPPPIAPPAFEPPPATPLPPVLLPPVAEAPKPPTAGAPVKNAKMIVGTFVHKPNPFIAETLTVADDGSFSYKDSNGATVSGNISFENDVMKLTAGEVVRQFTATLEGSMLTLTCAKDDAPRFKNDLATMSPTVLKSARYEKK